MLHFLVGLVNFSRVREQDWKSAISTGVKITCRRPLTIPCWWSSVQGVFLIKESALTTFLTGNVSLVCLSLLSIMV